MSIRLLFFASLREVTGIGELNWPWPESGGTVDDLLVQLFDQYPGLQSWNDALLVAVDLEYAGRDTRLSPGQEVAIMPPVQGG
jgi:molybdopterin converting factor small subunit